ncbi:MAG: branched-chain amino acid ABC transporter permease [Chloroflexi bacterium]|jgi:4-azaleucine resistance transporter AzlC|nr:branched-chain amino acid ABC transporter permease [Chloroflexota bacterium]
MPRLLTVSLPSATIARMSASCVETERPGLWAGFRATLPVALGCVPFGLAYGAVAAASLSPWQTSLMSLTVFAGTAQFVAVSMLAQGADLLSVWFTCVLVNLRLLLLSAAVSPHLQGIGAAQRLASAQALTDESFAVSLGAFRTHDAKPVYLVGSGLAIYLFWQIATLVGRLASGLIPQGFGLEYALSASLICLLFMLVHSRRQWVVALLAIVLALVSRLWLPDAWVVLAATMIAATVGLGLKRWL